MPFKSKAQRRKFAELLVKGEISPETFEEWNRETGAAELPERVGARKPAARKGAKRKQSTSARRPARKTTRRAARKSTRAVAKKSARKSARR
jgi:hypothetical protein